MKKILLIPACLMMAVFTVQAQIVITGVSDDTIYADQVTFTVSDQAGYTYDARLDGVSVPVGSAVEVTDVDYHELQVSRTNDTTLAVDSTLVQFIIRNGDRGVTESGIPTHTPYALIPSPDAAFSGSQMRLIVPSSYPADMDIPVVVWVMNENDHAVRVNGTVKSPGQSPFSLYRGVGSGFLQGAPGESALDYMPQIGGLSTNKAIALETNVAWTSVSGTLGGSIVWSNHSRIAVTADLTLSSGATLTIGEGSVVRVSPGVDIYSQADVVINGTLEHPVVFAPLSAGQPWGGFIMPDSQGSVVATAAIFTGSGEDQDWLGTVGPGSHRPEQPLFALGADNTLTLTDSAAIYLAGQLGHSETGSDITLTRFLLQRATTGGEYEDAAFNVNDSAFIEFPVDSDLFEDGDHDCLYIKNGTHGFTNTLFGWTKDDGVDSGGDGAGLLEFRNCWFEGLFHEANSLSGTDKFVNHHHDVFLNSGQALEAGYGAPHGLLDDCLVSACMTGARFGDNYTDNRVYNGSMSATNSLLIYNHRDAWGFQWEDWIYHTNQMSIVSNWLTAPIARHPDNLVWNPSTDAWRLAAFVNTPAGAPVGVGMASHSGRFALTELGGGVPVGLSCFSTNTVYVDYIMDTPDQTLATGTVTFLPGEIIRIIPAPESIPPAADLIRVRITGVAGAELTGAPESWFLAPPSELVAAGSDWRYLDDGSDQGTAWRGLGFDDASWPSGPAELGYGDGDEATVVGYGPDSGNKYVTTYFRREFDVADPAAIGSLTLGLKRDDGGIVYLNGTEILRSNMPTGTVDYLTYTPEFTPDDGDSWFSSSVPVGLLSAGTNVLAVEIHQSTPGSSDLTFDCRLTSTSLPVIESDYFGTDWVLFWEDEEFILESAAVLDGPWESLGTPGPYTVTYGGTNGFFRLQKP